MRLRMPVQLQRFRLRLTSRGMLALRRLSLRQRPGRGGRPPPTNATCPPAAFEPTSTTAFTACSCEGSPHTAASGDNEAAAAVAPSFPVMPPQMHPAMPGFNSFFGGVPGMPGLPLPEMTHQSCDPSHPRPGWSERPVRQPEPPKQPPPGSAAEGEQPEQRQREPTPESNSEPTASAKGDRRPEAATTSASIRQNVNCMSMRQRRRLPPWICRLRFLRFTGRLRKLYRLHPG